MGAAMIYDIYIGGAVAAGLAVYLIYALFHPEKF